MTNHFGILWTSAHLNNKLKLNPYLRDMEGHGGLSLPWSIFTKRLSPLKVITHFEMEWTPSTPIQQ